MNPEMENRLDQAIVKRLHRLGAVPVDTSRLEKRLEKQLGLAEPDRTPPYAWLRWPSVAGIAAALVIATVIGVMSVSGPQAMAAPIELSRVHEQVMAGAYPALHASDLASAKQQLEALVQGTPRPDGEYPDRVQCCCGQALAGNQLAFIRTQSGTTPVTIIMMYGYHVCAGSEHEATDVQGRRFIVHHDNSGVQATLTARNDHWVCVMAALPTHELLNVASQIVF